MTESAQILIAQGESRRAARLAEACAARGHAVSIAPHGAAALEAALADVPDVLVAPTDLELIEAGKLAEILRANPRTQGIRVLFLGRDEAAGIERGVYADTLSLGARDEEVALRIEAILARRERVASVEREAEAQQEVQGRLAQIPLADLLQLFHMNRRTGTIELSRGAVSGGEDRGTVVLRDGNLIQATTGRVEGEKALYRLLAWRDGSFAFTPDRVTMTARISTPTRALLMEALRQMDEWDRVAEGLPSLSARARLDVPEEQLPQAVHPVTREVLSLLGQYEEIRDLLDHSAFPDYQILRTVQTLVERGWVKLERDSARGGEAAGDRLFDEASRRRLREWLQRRGVRGAPAGEAKLLLASADAEATRAFVRALRGLPGMQPSRAARGEGLAPTDLLPVGWLTVDESVRIELLHVPADPAFSACWPAVAQDSLGALVVLQHPAAESEAALRPLLVALRDHGADRIFHVLLLPKGERLAAEELQPSLTLLDEASLFLVPMEGQRDPIGLMRAALDRVLP